MFDNPPPHTHNSVIFQFLNQLTRPQFMLADKPYTEVLQSTITVSSQIISHVTMKNRKMIIACTKAKARSTQHYCQI